MMQMLNSLINNISNLFKFNLKSKKHEQNDNLLLFPYIDEETIIKHPLIDEYNLTRLFSVQNYLNKKIHKSKRHIKLKPFYEQSKKLNWIGLVSDIKRPQEPNNTPILLIEKFAEFNDGKASLLDNHVWLNTRYIKAMNSTKQTIAIGEAIQGSSIIGAYTAKNGTEKYGLRETLLKGTGIFVGKGKRNDKITDLNTKFVTDYDRHNDWILKLSQQNSIDYSLCSKGQYNSLFNLPGHVDIRYQDSNTNNYISRQIAQNSQKHRKKRQKKISVSTKKTFKKVKNSILVYSIPTTRYYGEFNRYGFFNNSKGQYIPLIFIKNITDELNNPVANQHSFLLTQNIIEIGQLKQNEKIVFETKSIKNTNPEFHGKIKSIRPINKKITHEKLPIDQNILIGLILYNMNDQSVEHLPFLEKYRAWATENNITLPKQKNRKLINLKNKTEIAQQIDISEKQFEQLIKKLRIAPKYISDNVPYYDQNAVKKLRQEIQLKKMLTKAKHKNSIGIRQLSMADAERLKGDSLNATHTVLETANGSFYYAGFDTITQKEIKEVIYELSNYQQDVYLKVQQINDNKTAYICVKDIADFKTVMGDTIFYL